MARFKQVWIEGGREGGREEGVGEEKTFCVTNLPTG
jgi:hypothetical protein